MIQTKEQQQEILKRNESIRDLCDNSRGTNTHIMGDPQGEEKEQGRKSSKEIMAPNFPSLIKMLSTDLKVSMPNNVSTNKTTTAHVVKLLNDKEKILKAAMEKQLFTGEQ